MGIELTGKQKRFLRGRGHHIKALVHIGKLGLAPTLIGQVAECLLAHELVKVKVLESCPVTKAECAEAISQATGASLAQSIGRTLLLYKPHPEQPVLKLPTGAKSAPGASTAPEAESTPPGEKSAPPGA